MLNLLNHKKNKLIKKLMKPILEPTQPIITDYLNLAILAETEQERIEIIQQAKNAMQNCLMQSLNYSKKKLMNC
jgi:hypothetical protein